MRRTLLTPETQATICGEIQLGSPIKHAAALAGVHCQTVFEWLRRGEKDIQDGDENTIHAVFSAAVAQARAAKVKRLVGMIEEAGKIPSKITGQMDIKGAMFLLERTEPEFKQQTKVDADVQIKPGDAHQELTSILESLSLKSKPSDESTSADEPTPR